MKPPHVPRRGKGRKRENDEGINLRYILSTYVNITMYPCTTVIC
jgi:hypothetical protein